MFAGVWVSPEVRQGLAGSSSGLRLRTFLPGLAHFWFLDCFHLWSCFGGILISWCVSWFVQLLIDIRALSGCSEEAKELYRLLRQPHLQVRVVMGLNFTCKLNLILFIFGKVHEKCVHINVKWSFNRFKLLNWNIVGDYIHEFLIFMATCGFLSVIWVLCTSKLYWTDRIGADNVSRSVTLLIIPWMLFRLCSQLTTRWPRRTTSPSCHRCRTTCQTTRRPPGSCVWSRTNSLWWAAALQGLNDVNSEWGLVQAEADVMQWWHHTWNCEQERVFLSVSGTNFFRVWASLTMLLWSVRSLSEGTDLVLDDLAVFGLQKVLLL